MRQSETVSPKRFWRVSQILLLILLVGVLSACGNRGQEAEPTAVSEAPTQEPTIQPTPEPPAEPTETPLPPTATPVPEPTATFTPVPPLPVTVGVNPGFAPFVSENEAGDLVGFDIELMTLLAQTGNLAVTYETMAFEELLARVESGELDAAISAITVTEERQQRMAFSDVYFQTGQSLLSYFGAGIGMAVQLDNTTIMGVDDLTPEMSMGVKQGTTSDTFATENLSVQIQRFVETEETIEALRSGSVDAIIMDVAVITASIRPQPVIKLVGRPLTSEDYAIAVPLGKPDVLQRINEALMAARASGEYDRLIQEYFGGP